jgi:hypothetical protein
LKSIFEHFGVAMRQPATAIPPNPRSKCPSWSIAQAIVSHREGARNFNPRLVGRSHGLGENKTWTNAVRKPVYAHGIGPRRPAQRPRIAWGSRSTNILPANEWSGPERSGIGAPSHYRSGRSFFHQLPSDPISSGYGAVC